MTSKELIKSYVYPGTKLVLEEMSRLTGLSISKLVEMAVTNPGLYSNIQAQVLEMIKG